MTAAHPHAASVRRVPWTEIVLSLLARTPEGMTSAQIGRELSGTSDGASKVAQQLYRQGRITREVVRGLGQCPQWYIWKAKT